MRVLGLLTSCGRYALYSVLVCIDRLNELIRRALHGVLGDVSSDDSGVNTADDFATFLKGSKVESVHASTATTTPYDVPFKETPTLSEWTPVTTDEIENLIGSVRLRFARDLWRFTNVL